MHGENLKLIHMTEFKILVFLKDKFSF